MFSIMGENIHRLSKDIVQYTNNMIKETTPILLRVNSKEL